MMTLSEAALKLDEELKTHYNLSKWAYLGINEDPREPEIIIYTQTKKDAQHLLGFLTTRYEGYFVRIKVIGKVMILTSH